MFTDLRKVKEEFERYTRSFDMTVPMIRVKYTHSYDVMRFGERLTGELALSGPGWNEDARNTGIAACLLHDTGRFSQYRDFGTYYDGASVDHGDRGYDVLTSERECYAAGADEEAWEAILQAVKWHNKKSLPDKLSLSDEVMPFCRLARDADKLDVFQLVQRRMDEGTIGELLPRHKADAPLSEALLDEIEANWSGSYKNASSLQDFLLIQLTWVLDMNFAPSLRILEESGALTRIRGYFPKDNPRAAKVLDGLFSRMEEHKKSVNKR